MPNHPSNEDLFAYRDGELLGEKRLLIEAHVVSCGICRELVDGMSAIESDLKLRPDDVGEDYYAKMTESVLGKIAAGARSAAATQAEADTRAAAAEAPRMERRHPAGEAGDEPRRRGPATAWFGVVGAGAAAASVIVVVLMLAQRQGEWVRAPRPSAPGVLDDRVAARADSAAERGAAKQDAARRKREAAAGKKNEAAPGEAKDQARLEKASTPAKEDAARSQEKAPDLSTSARVEFGGAADEPETRSADEELRQGERALASKAMGRAQAPESAAGAPAPVPGGVAPPGDAYAAALRAHGLPPVFDPARVSPDALIGAESDLRLLYQLGRAGSDSARVRLYLAEAGRARLDPGDAEAVEEVIHHYRRAIRLAANDPATAAMARRRLVEFLQEVERE